MTKTEFLARHQAAGEAYETTARAYVAAWIELNACDNVRRNTNLAFEASHHNGFAAVPEVAPHAEFLPEYSAVHGHASDRSRALAEQIVNAIKS